MCEERDQVRATEKVTARIKVIDNLTSTGLALPRAARSRPNDAFP